MIQQMYLLLEALLSNIIGTENGYLLLKYLLEPS